MSINPARGKCRMNDLSKTGVELEEELGRGKLAKWLEQAFAALGRSYEKDYER
jgi:hypothetical protein